MNPFFTTHRSTINPVDFVATMPTITKADDDEAQMQALRQWEAARAHNGKPLGEKVVVWLSVVVTVGMVVGLAMGWVA